MKNFQSLYKKDDLIYFIRDDVSGKKEIKELIVKTIYPQTIIAVEERGMSYCIDFKDKEKIFADEYGAKRYMEGEDGT